MGKRNHYTEGFVENFKSLGNKTKNKVGNVYNNITVIKHKEGHVWFMRCHCGTLFSGVYYNLRSGSILGCGCNTFDNMRATKGVSTETIVERLKVTQPSYQIITVGESLKDKWDMRCRVCDTSFTSTPEVMLDKRGRSSCRCSNQYRRTYKEWVEEVTQVCNEKDLTFISFKDDKPKKAGQFTYKCNTCSLINTTRVEHILGDTGCPVCNGQNQKQNYLFEIWDGDTLIAYKMGIAIEYKRRLKEQQSKTSNTIKVHSVYEMTTAELCRRIEKHLLNNIPNNYLTKEQYPDGFSETVPVEYQSSILSEYKEYGKAIVEGFINDKEKEN